MINYSAVAQKAGVALPPTQINWQLQMRPSENVVDGLISCEYSNEIMKDFVIGGKCADSKSNGP
jgi:hypothetical protein